MSGIPACGYCVQFAFQFSITAYPVFRQEIHGLGGLFQIVQLRPMGEACTLLRLDVVLNINEQADLSVLLFRLAGRSGVSGDPGSKGFFAHMEDLLRNDYGVAKIVLRTKPNYSAPAPAGIVGEIRSWDAVISGIGD